MALLTLGKSPIVSGLLERPHRGSWTADLEVDSDSAPTGKLTLEGAGLSLVGTVVTSQSWNDRQRARVVAGAGGMTKELGPAWYVNTTLRTVAKAILDAVGETISPTSQIGPLSKRVPAWLRFRGTANTLLDQALAVYSPGAVWRHLPDGTVWIGVPEWTTVTTAAVVQDNRGDEDSADLAGDDLSLDAGVTVLGRKVGFVQHTIRVDQLRTKAWWVTSRDRGIKAAIATIVERLVGPRLDARTPYAAKVVVQHADGTLDLIPDSDRIPQLTSVPICYGDPGVTAKVKQGARVFVQFADGDPSKPHVTGWTAGAVDTLSLNADTVVLVDGTQPIARRGDLVQVALPLSANVVAGSPVLWTPITDPNPLAKAYGVIMSGKSTVLG